MKKLILTMILLGFLPGLQAQEVKREITRVTGDVYRFQNRFHVNMFVVTGAGVVVTDPINAEAARWLKAAADQHHSISQYELGVLHANGNGVPKDQSAAYFWFALAALQGFPPAMRAQIRLRQTMPPAEFGLIDSQVREWLQERVGDTPAPPLGEAGHAAPDRAAPPGNHGTGRIPSGVRT